MITTTNRRSTSTSTRITSEASSGTNSSPSTAAAVATASTSKQSGQNKNDKESTNIFLDNIGTIFLSAIGLVILSVVRTSYATRNKRRIREDVEETSLLDPFEIDDLRVANTELTTDVFRTIMDRVRNDFPNGTATYRDFVRSVRIVMCHLKGEAFTVELGHLLDMAVLGALDQQRRGRKAKGEDRSPQNGDVEDDDVIEDDEIKRPLVFWLAILSMALSSSTSDRIRVLFESIELQEGRTPILRDVHKLVGYLQDSYQLPPDAQVVESKRKYPFQEYHRGDPVELVRWDGSSNTDTSSPEEEVDLEAFAGILRSSSVCAWGECYLKVKPAV